MDHVFSDQKITLSAASPLQQARLAKGYSVEDLAIATGLTADEIAAAERPDGAARRHYIERIEHALR